MKMHKIVVVMVGDRDATSFKGLLTVLVTPDKPRATCSFHY